MKIADNSGAKIAKCINVRIRKAATLGDLIRVTVYKLNSKKKLQKKKLYNGIIISVKNKTRRFDDSFVQFSQNRVLLLSDMKKFLGSRIYGPICKEIRGGNNELRYKKIISCARGRSI